jgi:hypothetical protein
MEDMAADITSLMDMVMATMITTTTESVDVFVTSAVKLKESATAQKRSAVSSRKSVGASKKPAGSHPHQWCAIPARQVFSPASAAAQTQSESVAAEISELLGALAA